MPVKNIKKSDVVANAKSAKFAYIITLIAAAVIDWKAVSAIVSALDGAKLTSKIPFLEGVTEENEMHEIECKAGTVIPVINPGEAPMDGNAQITGIVEGLDEKTLDWAYSMQGEEVVAIVERCSDGKKFAFLNPCTGGLTFQYQSIGAQDGGNAGINFQLTGSDCPKPMLVYEPATASQG